MEVIISDNAKIDLADISDYIALDNPSREDSFIDELLDHCHSLNIMPRAYPLVGRYRRSEIRKCTHGDYLIFYRISKDSIIITRILNAARDYNALPLGS